MKNKKGFTLIELIIVIAILAIIMLIGTAAYSSIQERMKVRADKATAAQIGKAIKIRETDVGEENGIGLYPEIIEYDSIDGIENYIAKEIKPQSMEDGNFVATAFQTQTGKKIVVGIGKKVGEEGSENYSMGDKVYNGKDEAGWAWSEDTKIEEFLKDESIAGTIATGGVEIPEVYSQIKVGDKIYYPQNIDGVNGLIAQSVGTWKVIDNKYGQITIAPTYCTVWINYYYYSEGERLAVLDDICEKLVDNNYAEKIMLSKENLTGTYEDYEEYGGGATFIQPTYRYEIYPTILLKRGLDIYGGWDGYYFITGFEPRVE